MKEGLETAATLITLEEFHLFLEAEEEAAATTIITITKGLVLVIISNRSS